MHPVSFVEAPVAHQFDPDLAPHPLAILSVKASCNGVMLIPAPEKPILGYDLPVWGVRTSMGPCELVAGDWIVEHPALGVLVFTDERYKQYFSTAQT